LRIKLYTTWPSTYNVGDVVVNYKVVGFCSCYVEIPKIQIATTVIEEDNVAK
jgi:hypothetical protein